MNILKSLWASMMELTAPAPKGFVKKVFRKKVKKKEQQKKELILAAQRKRFKRIDRNINNEKHGAYTNAIS